MNDSDTSRRKIIYSAVANISLNVGFEKAEVYALETLAEMLSLIIGQISVSTKLFAELQGRTEVNLHDVSSALVELGIDYKSLLKYIYVSNQQNTRLVAKPVIEKIPQPPPVLHTSKIRPHLSYIHEHFPLFPDSHTYIVTESGLSNEREYFKIREIIANQKYNMEKALIQFKLKNELLSSNSKTLSIFREETENTAFMVIPNKNKQTKYPSYYDALLPYDEAASYDNEMDNEVSDSMTRRNKESEGFQEMQC